jgi:hypothetical protein
MAEQWIDAATARRLVAEDPVNQFATDALCQRAHAGLVETRARLFVTQHKRVEDVPVPRMFWQSTAAVDLSEDWQTGDFMAWISRTEQWRAFGVTFALGGVLEMLPFEQRARTARRLSVAGNPA